MQERSNFMLLLVVIVAIVALVVLINGGQRTTIFEQDMGGLGGGTASPAWPPPLLPPNNNGGESGKMGPPSPPGTSQEPGTITTAPICGSECSKIVMTIEFYNEAGEYQGQSVTETEPSGCTEGCKCDFTKTKIKIISIDWVFGNGWVQSEYFGTTTIVPEGLRARTFLHRHTGNCMKK